MKRGLILVVALALALCGCPQTPPPPVVVVHGAQLDWTVTAAETPYITSFQIYRASVSGGPYTFLTVLGSTVRTFLDTSQTTGMTSFYVVTATAGGLETAFSNEVKITIP